MKFFSLLFFGAISALLVSSCSKDSGISSPRETVFAYYKLVYDAAAYSSVATVDFHDGTENGAKIDLGFSAKGKVTFNQTASSYKPSTYTFYKEYSNKQTSLTVRYNYIVGTIEYRNVLQLAKDIALPASLSAIDRSLGTTITFGGNSIASQEMVVLSIDSLKFTNKIVGSNRFDLSPQDLASLSAGSANVSIQRHKVYEASEGSAAGGKLEGIYIAASKTVTIL